MESFEQKKQPVVVEIGPGDFPVYELFENVEVIRKIEKGEARFVAVNCDRHELYHIKEKGGDVVAGDIANLPLKDNSADQIWLMNVFSEFRSLPIDKKPDGTLIIDSSDPSSRIFSELSRVAKPGSEIYIGEIYPPVGKLAGSLKDIDFSNFGLEKDVYRGVEGIKEFLQKINISSKAILETVKRAKNYEPFFMILRKPDA